MKPSVPVPPRSSSKMRIKVILPTGAVHGLDVCPTDPIGYLCTCLRDDLRGRKIAVEATWVQLEFEGAALDARTPADDARGPPPHALAVLHDRRRWREATLMLTVRNDE